MSMGGFPEERHKIVQKSGKATQSCRRSWPALLFVAQEWNNLPLHNFVLGGPTSQPKSKQALFG